MGRHEAQGDRGAALLRGRYGSVVFVEDYTFRTPSGAALAVLGRSANGWAAWKSKSGKTLDELKRQPAGADDGTRD